MNQQSSEWAMGELMCNLLKHVYPNRDGGVSVDPGPFEKLLCDALDAARKVPEGCVRLPDGRDIEPPYYVSIVPGLLQPWEAYIERAIVIARKDGTR